MEESEEDAALGPSPSFFHKRDRLH